MMNFSGKLFNLVLTDPPYNVNYTGGTKDKLQIENDNMTSADFYFLFLNFIKQLVIILSGGIYVFHADSERCKL
jgi:DNA modification methylase